MRCHRIYTLAECTSVARIIPRAPATAVTATVVLLVALIGAGALWAALTSADLVVRAPARVRAKQAPKMSFSASSGERVFAASTGRVSRVAVVEGQPVAAGDLVAVLDTTQLENDLARFEAELVAARTARDGGTRMLALSEAQYIAAQDARHAELAQTARDEGRARRRRTTDIELARSALATASRDAERLRALEADGAASTAQVETAEAKVTDARAQLAAAQLAAAGGRAEVLRKQITLAERDHAIAREQLAREQASQAATLAGAERRLANLRVDLAKATLRAEVAGIISGVAVAPGDVVQAGQALFTVTPRGGLRVDAAVAASDVAHLEVGMAARIRFDAYDWQRYGTVSGVIRQISADAEPLQTAGGQAMVYTVAVELDREHIGRGAWTGKLKLGMTGTVEIVTGRERLLPLLLGELRQGISL